MKNMTLVCSGKVCTSTENTLIDGEKIRFYELPSDEKLRDAWKKLFRINNNAKIDTDAKEVLCELHFDKNCFDDNKQLKPDSIPTYESFGKSLVSPKFSSAYDEPSVKKAKMENSMDKTNIVVKQEDAVAGKMTPKKVKPYRLTVQIDKICLKPSPKNKKQSDIKIYFTSPCVTSQTYKSLGQTTEARNGMKLPAYNQCLVCKKVFLDATDLYSHLKDHFTCDICKMVFTSRKSYSKHYKIHESGAEDFPFKCHICNSLFLTKDGLKNHEHIKKLPKTSGIKLYNCKDCNVTFKNDNTYKKHMLIHEQESKEENKKQNKSKAVSIQEKPIEFDCRICQKKLSNIMDAESHARFHASEKTLVPIAL